MRMQCALVDGSNILIRPPSEDDASVVYEAVDSSRNELAPWMPWCHQGYCLEDAKSWIREATNSENARPFLILDLSEKVCLGTCGLNEVNRAHCMANLGYWVRTDYTGRGIASAATRRVAEFAFAELSLTRVEIVAAVGNLASQRVADKAGATHEGVLRNRLVHGENAMDSVMFSLIPKDLNGN